MTASLTSINVPITPDKRIVQLHTRYGGVLSRAVGLSIARISVQFFNGISLIFVARLSGPEDFGRFSIAWSVLLGLSGIAALGLPVFTLRAAVLGRNKATGFGVFLNLVTSVSAAVTGLLLLLATSRLSAVVLVLLAGSVVLEKNSEVRIALGTEFGQARIVNWSLGLRGISAFLIFIALAHAGVGALLAFSVSRFVFSALVAGVLTKYIRGFPMVTRPPSDGSLESFRPMALEVAIGSLRSFDITVIGVFAGEVVAGLYSAVQKLVTPVIMLAGSFSSVIMGPATRVTTRRLASLMRNLAFASFGALAITSISTYWSRQLVQFVLGSQFSAAAGAFGWMLIALPAFAVTPILSTVLQARGKARYVSSVTIVMTLTVLALTPYAARNYGATAAAAILSITMWLRVSALFIATNRFNRIAPHTSGTAPNPG